MEEEVKKFLEEQRLMDSIWRYEEFVKMEKAFPLKVLRQVIIGILNKRIELAEKALGKEYGKYLDLAKKNIPYNERVAMTSAKTDRLKKYIEDTKHIRANFVVRPLQDWLRRGDYQMMKRLGVTKFLNAYLEVAIKSSYELSKRTFK